MNVMLTTNTLWIADSVLSQMRQLARRYAPLETGGMLLGYEAANQEAVVTAMIGPGPHARHRRFRFRPDPDYQQSHLEAHFARTHGRETYLGDWHTHPSGACALSWMDKRVLARIASTPSSGTVHPIMLVLAGSGVQWALCATRLLTFRKGCFPRADLLQLEPQSFLDGKV
jgi:integrative and conjugative element protein (TIGR02256 family)